MAAANSYYSDSGDYSTDGIAFNKEAALTIINTNDSYIDGDTTLPKYYIDDSIYWTKNKENLERYMKVFTMPYNIVYEIQNQIASFYLTSISENITMNMIEEEINTSANFSISSMKVERDSIDSEDDGSYKITISLIANGDVSNAINDTDNNTGSIVGNTIMLKGFIYDSQNVMRGYFNFDYDSATTVDTNLNIYTFVGKIQIDDSLSETGFTNMKNMYSITDLNCSDVTDNDKILYENNIAYIPKNVRPDKNFLNLAVQDLRIVIGCYYRDSIIEEGETITNVSDVYIAPLIKPDENGNNAVICRPVTNGVDNYPQFVYSTTYSYTDEDGTPYNKTVNKFYTLANVYDNTNNLLNLYIDMSNIIRSAVVPYNVTTEQDGSQKTINMLNITDVPVIQYSQAINDTVSKRVTNVITDSYTNLSELSKSVTNNFSIDYKFFRTYGPCRYFKLENIGALYTIDPDGAYKYDENTKTYVLADSSYTGTRYSDNTTINLGNLDITIEFDLLMKTNIKIGVTDAINQLKTYIKQNIEELNNSISDDIDDYTIYISNIITDIEIEFVDFVRSIELVSINGNPSSYRIIRYDKPQLNEYNTGDSKTVREYIPEYINVPIDNITINVRT